MRVIAFFCLLIASTFASKTICVTGGAGFIGGHFVEHMFNTHPDYNIIILDSFTYSGNIKNIPELVRNSPRVKIVRKSICDKAAVDQIFRQVDFVVHFAAETDVTRSISDDEVFFDTNVMGTRNLLHHLVKYKNSISRFVHISSSEVYGTCAQDVITEEHPLNPMSPYAASKAGADRAVYAYGCTYDVPVVILRFFNNYGPRQHIEKVVGKFITFGLTNSPIPIHGNGTQMRDWIHATDTARAIDAALHVKDFSNIKNQVINCGSGKATSIIDIAQVIQKRLGFPASQIQHTPDRPGQVHKHLSSTDKAKRLLNWEPKISLEEGLNATIDWYVENPNFWNQEINVPQIYKDNNVLIFEKRGKL